MNEDSLGKAELIISQRKSEIEAFIAGAAIAEIEDQAGYDSAVTLGKAVKTKWNEAKEQRKGFVDPLRAVIKKIDDGFDKFMGPLKLFEQGIKRACLDFQGKKEAEGKEAQRKAEEEARKERERIEAQARAQREKEEAARQAEEEARRKASLEQDATKRKALEAEAEKRRKEAEAAAAKAQTKELVASTVVAPVIEDAVCKQGVSGVQKWRVEVIDKLAFLKWALETGALEYLQIDTKMLDKEATQTKGVRKWPGITAIQYSQARMRL